MAVVTPPSSAGKIPAQSRSVSFPQPAKTRPNSGNRPMGNKEGYYAGAPPARQAPVAKANEQQYSKAQYPQSGGVNRAMDPNFQGRPNPVRNSENYYAGAPPARQTPVAPANKQQYDKSGYPQSGGVNRATDPKFQGRIPTRTKPTTPPASSAPSRTPNSTKNRAPYYPAGADPYLGRAAEYVGRDVGQDVANRNSPAYQEAKQAEQQRLKDAEDLRNNPVTRNKMRQVEREQNAPFPLSPFAEAERYGTTPRQWINLSPQERKQKRDQHWDNNPLNPLGKHWNWAPWNDRKNPKSLNAPPSAYEPLWPPGTNPPPGTFQLPGTDTPGQGFGARVYSTNADRWVTYDRLVSFSFNMVGGWLKAEMSVTFWRSLPNGQFELIQGSINADPDTFSLLGPNGQPVPGIQPAPGEGRPWPSPETGMNPVQTSPGLAPQWEPNGDPSYPLKAQPDTHPSLTPRPTAPAAAPRPAPAPQQSPNIPALNPLTMLPLAAIPALAPSLLPAVALPGLWPSAAPQAAPSTAPMPSRVPHIQQRYEPLGSGQQTPQFANTPWRAPEIINQRLGQPQPQQTAEPTNRDLQQQMQNQTVQIKQEIQNNKPQPTPCQYKEDDFAIANVTQMTGINPVTNEPQFTIVPMQVHEKLKDYIEWQSETLAKIQGQADGLRGRLKRIADRLQIVRILTILGNIASIHNALMLSRDISSTLGELASLLLTKLGQVGGILGENDTIDVNEQIGKVFNEFMKDAIGEDLWKGTKKSWLLLNRIVMSASSIIYNIRSATDAARSIGEFTANNIGFIGNALKKWGVVSENAYPWMSTNVTSRTAFQAKMDRIREGLEQLDDTVSTVNAVVNDGVEIADSVNEANRNLNELNKSIKEGVAIVYPDNEPNKNAATQTKSESKGQNVDDLESLVGALEE